MPEKPKVDKARLAKVFGEPLPERDPDDKEPTSEEWLRAQRPPHHGG